MAQESPIYDEVAQELGFDPSHISPFNIEDFLLAHTYPDPPPAPALPPRPAASSAELSELRERH